ncbi:MAG: hypothetical protein HY791_32485 [Deltaproteobacteria bacterium]|nr:hypothetical protein [Deltaproteobacteria bacterium]
MSERTTNQKSGNSSDADAVAPNRVRVGEDGGMNGIMSFGDGNGNRGPHFLRSVRTSAYAVNMFLVGRGYHGGLKSSEAMTG